jgi:hypothetical protein
VQPVPWVCLVSMRALCQTRAGPDALIRTSQTTAPGKWPPFSNTARQPSFSRSSAAACMAATLSMLRPVRISASGRLGVSTAARATSSRFRASTAAGSISGAPPFATMTGSTTSGAAAARSASTSATVSITAASCSIPVLTASAPISSSTTSICCRMNAGGIGSTPNTPSVFCAVNAVMAVAAKASSIVTVLISAWMPAPPPESEPAMISTRPFIGPRRASFCRLRRRLDRVCAARRRQQRRADVLDDGR